MQRRDFDHNLPVNVWLPSVDSALGVYTVRRTLTEAKRNFREALDLHLSVIREKATKEIATLVARR